MQAIFEANLLNLNEIESDTIEALNQACPVKSTR